MDLAASAKRVWVLMEHQTKDKQPRLVRTCGYPLTAPACVDRIYTNLAVLQVTEAGFKVLEMVPGLTLDALQARTEAQLVRP
jgi:3-oxoadipate CoA-transferase beta subunit